jgi:glycosyltransferase involved in cell wall biosynthesis
MESLVTVYITNFNYSNYIKKAIESVLGQTYQNFELFIIDDGSSDESHKIIEEYRTNPKITIIYQKNKGLNITNNIALKLSSGKYIVRLDADDYFHNKAIEIMVSELDANPEIGLVFPDYFEIDAHDEITNEFKRLNFDSDVTLLDLPAHGACTMIRTSFLRDVGGYSESYKCQDGYELWVKFTSKYRVKNVSKSLFYYRRHGNNLTNNEVKILKTRFNIKNDYVKGNDINIPKTLCLIPVRNRYFQKKNLAFHKIGDENLLEHKINSVLNTKYVKDIAVIYSNDEIGVFLEENYPQEKIRRICRPETLAGNNKSIVDTISYALDLKEIKKEQFESVLVLSIEFPLLKSDTIDEAVLTTSIFEADSCISVRSDDSIFYQHHGNGLIPILEREKSTRLEREALYKSVGGLYYTYIQNFLNARNLLNGKVSHVIVDKNGALEIQSEQDLDIAEFLIKKI